LKQLVHIALAGSTRQGKTSIIRQLLAELIYIGCECILLDPHYTPYDVEIDEDWTPYTPYLKANPLECKEFGKIEQVLRYAATTYLEKRKALRAASKRIGKDVFIFIDEYPAIIAEKPEVQKHVAKLLREGGKYHIHLVIASQDFQVKTVSPQAGGAIRDNFSTCLYVGGDKTTANVLLDKSIPAEDEPRLGKGPIYLRCETHKAASLAYTPWMDNEAIYELVGPSTYEPGEDEEEVDTEELDDLELDTDERDTLNDAARSTQHAARSTLENAQNETNLGDAARSSSLPDGWTQREVDAIKFFYPNLKNRDLMLKALGRPHTDVHRTALDIILKQENLVVKE
jgi:hypothetical protein